MTLRIINVVTPTFGQDFSGQARFVFSLLHCWNIEGISLGLFGTDLPPILQNKGSFEENGENSAVSWSTSPSFRWNERALWTLRLLATLFRERKHYDIVHAHVMHWGTLLMPLVAHLLGKKAVYVITRQGFDNPSAIALHRLGRLKVRLFRQYDGVIALSPALAQDCLKHGFSSKMVILPNPMMVKELKAGRDKKRRAAFREQLGISLDDKVILFVGSIIPRKGVDIVGNVFCRLMQTRSDVRLVMVGPMNTAESSKVDESYVDRIRNRFHQDQVEHRVHWAGLVKDQKRLADYYHIADVFLLPTHAEGSPNVFAEAMAGELPVVTTHLVGITDATVTPGINGYLVDEGDVDGFVIALNALLDDPKLRKEMGKAGREKMLRRFGFDSYCSKLAAFYRRVMDR